MNTLRGMTWSHPRGYDPMVATAAEWKQRTGVEIVWDKRSLQDFESFPVEDLARQFSDDGSAPQGGDLGWAGPGTFVPEFDEAMNKLQIGGISPPVASRFGVHLIQVMERRETTMENRQLREQARNVLREQKFDDAYTEWLRELRARAYVEMREAPN